MENTELEEDAVQDKVVLIESLLERAIDYGKTSLKIVKLNAVDKTSDILSTVIPHTLVFGLLSSFLLFLSLGFAYWLGEYVGKISYGFFITGGFYGFIALIILLFFHKWMKRVIGNYIIKQVLK